MELAVITADKIAVMFVIAAIGMCCFKKGLIDAAANERLSDILLTLVSPLLIFTSYQQEYSADKLKGLLTAILMALISHGVAIGLASVLIKKRQGGDYQIERMAAIYSNCGFMGIPLVSAVFGTEGVFFVTAYITVFNLLVWTHGVALMTGRTDLSSFLEALKAPCVIAVLLGFAFFVCRIRLPQILTEPMSLVADMNTPLAMLIAGVSIADSNILSMLKNRRIYYVCSIRLLLIPAAVIPILKMMSVDNMITVVIIMATVCPTASSGTLFAIRYHKNSVYASELFGVTTALSLATIPLLMLACGSI